MYEAVLESYQPNQDPFSQNLYLIRFLDVGQAKNFSAPAHIMHILG